MRSDTRALAEALLKRWEDIGLEKTAMAIVGEALVVRKGSCRTRAGMTRSRRGVYDGLSMRVAVSLVRRKMQSAFAQGASAARVSGMYCKVWICRTGVS